MKQLRTWSFVFLLLTIGFVGLMEADGDDFCNMYEGWCEVTGNGFVHIGNYENCEEQESNYCSDAWIECVDHCGGGPWDFFCDGGPTSSCESFCQCT